MGGKSLKRNWSAKDIEKALKRRKEEKKKTKKLSEVL